MEVVKLVNSLGRISQQAYEQLSYFFYSEKFSKGETIFKKDRSNTKEYLLIDGICRSYILNPDGEDITLSFYTEGVAISPNISRTKNKISTINLQALTNVELISFSSDSLIRLMISNIEIREWGNNILQNELLQKVEKELAHASMTARERLVLFRKNYRILENLIPHPYIASYLGITPISLSRLRKELAS